MGQKEDIEKVTSKIILIRDKQVILDRDVAELYGVTTREINQALKNNPRKFPSDFVIELTNSEKQEVIKNFDNLKGLKFSRVAPHAFTEQGLYACHHPQRRLGYRHFTCYRQNFHQAAPTIQSYATSE